MVCCRFILNIKGAGGKGCVILHCEKCSECSGCSEYSECSEKIDNMEITLTIERAAVLKEVANTTSYTGMKKTDDESAIERIPTVDEDEQMLLRFWNESRAEVAKFFIRILSSEGMNEGNYELKLNVTEGFNMALVPSMELGLFSFFVNNITGLWYMYTNKEEAMAYIERGQALLEEVQEKGHYEKIHTRPMHPF